jgi:mannose-6-phosphate isomerase-like protein (cupin superfamily)
MAFERTRVRERDPAEATTYDKSMRFQLAIRERSLTGKVVIKGAERPMEESRQGYLKFFMSRESVTDSALKDWSVFLHDIRRHSGKHKHQGGLAIFVVEGEGYTVVNGERIDWEAGDLILLPIMPEGCEHQHFNRHADKPCKWIAFIHKPLWDEIGSYIEQRQNSPDFRG